MRQMHEWLMRVNKLKPPQAVFEVITRLTETLVPLHIAQNVWKYALDFISEAWNSWEMLDQIAKTSSFFLLVNLRQVSKSGHK